MMQEIEYINDIKVKKAAFTLAEVLITLSILGVVAAIMIPNTVHKIQDRQIVTGVKKAYSMIDNALQMSTIEFGPIYGSGVSVTDRLNRYLNVKEYCSDKSQHSWTVNRCTSSALDDNDPWGGYYSLNGAMASSRTGNVIDKSKYAGNGGCDPGAWIMLKNGMTLCFRSDLVNTNGGSLYAVSQTERDLSKKYGFHYIGWILVDINGKKAPNRYGYDVFIFAVDNRNGLFLLDMNKAHSEDSRVSKAYMRVFDPDSCSNKNANGNSCSYWVMKHGNTNYKYRDVSAEW